MAEAYTYSYEPAWQKGDVISSLRLNNIENGIRRSLNLIDDLEISNGPIEDGADSKYYIHGFSPSQTLETLTQHDGLISATFQDIYIDSAHITDRADGTGNQNIADTVVKTNSSGIIPSHLLPSYVDDIIECEDFAHFPSGSTDSNPDDSHAPSGPETGKIYVDLSTGRSYRWGGSEYIEVGVIHLNYNDDNGANHDQNINGADSAAHTAIFGTDDKKYVKKVTQFEGQIKVEHALFDPTINTTSSTGAAGDLFSITVGGNTSNTFTPTLASTAVYGVTKLNDDTVVSNALSEDNTLAVTALGVKNAIEFLDVSDTAVSTQYVSQVSETDGKIAVGRANFDPAITYTSGTATNAPTILFSVAGNNSNSNTATSFNKATTGLYGVTKLNSDTVSSGTITDDETLAVTTLGVHNIIDTLDVTDTVDATKYVSGVSETNGKINVSRNTFSPVLNHTVSTSLAAPYLSISIAGNESSAVALDTATTEVYGVTKLSDATNSTFSDIAATSKAVKDSLDTAKAYADAVTIPKSQISDLSTVTTAEAGLMTPEQKHSIELFDDLINNFTFNLTLQLPTEVTWDRNDNTGVVTAVPKTFSTDTTVSYQMNDGNGWVAYDGTQSYEGNHTFKAHVARSHAFNGTTYTAEADINETYEYIQESAPEGD